MASILNATTTSGLVTSADNSGSLQLQTNNGTTAVTIDTSQNVGIGTTSPTYKFQVQSAGQTNGYIYNSTNAVGLRLIADSSAAYVQTQTNHPLYFATNNGANALTVETNGNIKMNSGYGSAAVAYGCRAWVNFNGTGTVAIRGSGNVSSITDNATGDFTINFATSMPDANYSATLLTGGTGNSFWFRTYEDGTARSASALRIITVKYNDGANQDAAHNDLAFFR